MFRSIVCFKQNYGDLGQTKKQEVPTFVSHK